VDVDYNHQLVVDVVVDRTAKVVAASAFKHMWCVAEGTAIATPSGEEAVESLSPGDAVLAFDPERGERVVAHVERVARVSRPRTVLQIGRLLVSPEHPVFADGRFVRADAVRPGSELLSPALTVTPVSEAPSPLREPQVVYDLAVSWPHDFFAAGVLVHNKTIGVSVGDGAPWRGLFERTR